MRHPKASARHVLSSQYDTANRAGYKAPRRVPCARYAADAPGTVTVRKGEVGFVVDPKLRYA